jgi:hypothetical protein
MSNANQPEGSHQLLVEINQLRRLLCFVYAGAAAYTDDGELQDNRTLPLIDFRRDTPQEIQNKMLERSLKGAGKAQAIEAHQPTPKGSLVDHGVAMGYGLPDFPVTATSFRERAFYQLGVADERARLDNLQFSMDDPLPKLELGVYQHYNGNKYAVEGVARHSESLEPLVVYRSCKDPGLWWVRPYSMFIEPVEVDGVLQPRFSPVTGD